MNKHIDSIRYGIGMLSGGLLILAAGALSQGLIDIVTGGFSGGTVLLLVGFALVLAALVVGVVIPELIRRKG